MHQNIKLGAKAKLRKRLHLFLLDWVGRRILVAYVNKRNAATRASDPQRHQLLNQRQIVATELFPMFRPKRLVLNQGFLLESPILCDFLALKFNQNCFLRLFRSKGKVRTPAYKSWPIISFFLTFGGSDMSVVDVPLYCWF